MEVVLAVNDSPGVVVVLAVTHLLFADPAAAAAAAEADGEIVTWRRYDDNKNVEPVAVHPEVELAAFVAVVVLFVHVVSVRSVRLSRGLASVPQFERPAATQQKQTTTQRCQRQRLSAEGKAVIVILFSWLNGDADGGGYSSRNLVVRSNL